MNYSFVEIGKQKQIQRSPDYYSSFDMILFISSNTNAVWQIERNKCKKKTNKVPISSIAKKSEVKKNACVKMRRRNLSHDKI